METRNNTINIEGLIFKETGRTFDEIRAMSDVELYEFIEEIRDEAYSKGYDDAH